jgi:hypothetical protein
MVILVLLFACERWVAHDSRNVGTACLYTVPPERLEPNGKDTIVSGSLDKSVIDAVVNRNMNEIRYCYTRELRKEPGLAGEIIVKFVISNTGWVPKAEIESSTMGNPAVESCITSRFDYVQFPEPKGGGTVVVSYPFVFTPEPQPDQRKKLRTVNFVAGEPLRVEFETGECLSSSCTGVELLSCTVSVGAGTILVEAKTSWKSDESYRGCTQDCEVLTTTCDVGPLDEGTWTMVLGDESITFAVPSKQQAYKVCVSNR